MVTAPICRMSTCEREAILAIRTSAPRGKALTHTIWQREEDAPKTAARYCGPCGIPNAISLALGTIEQVLYGDSDIRRLTIEVTDESEEQAS